jgi:DNA-binding winged helix-turn-helix (wHTH) protein
MAQWRDVAVPAGVPGLSSGQQELHGWMFDVFRVDQREARLWRGQEVVPLHPKPFAVLCCLVTQAGQLVTKDALLEAVWPGTVGSEAVLQVAIRHLRQVLGDQVRTPRFIETVHGRGYRFIAPVHAAAPPGGPAVMGALRAAPPPRFRPPRHFVGRDAALTQVQQWWTSAQQGTRQVGVIAGEPGIGKTALVEAFLAQVAASGACRVGTRAVCRAVWPGRTVSARVGSVRTPRSGTGWLPSGGRAAAVCAELARADAGAVAAP